MTIFKHDESSVRIDCDGLTEEDWETLALMASPLLPRFGYVLGISSGGRKLAEKMRLYSTKNSKLVLIADGVYTETTGESLFKLVENIGPGRVWWYLCVFTSVATALPAAGTAIFTAHRWNQLSRGRAGAGAGEEK